VLAKVILSVHSSDKLEAESVIEAYAFNFTYVGDTCSDNVQVLLEKTQRMEIDAEQSPTVDNKGKGTEVCSPSYSFRKAVAESEREKGLSLMHIKYSLVFFFSTSVKAQCSCVFYLSLFSLSTEEPFQKGKARGCRCVRSSLLQLLLLHIQQIKISIQLCCLQCPFDYLRSLNFCHVSLHFVVISAEIP